MKNLFYSILILLSLSSCTETIYEEVIKTRYDSVVIKAPPDTVVVTDTVKVIVEKVRYDSIPYPVFVHDTVFVPQIVKEVIYDTIIQKVTETKYDTIIVERIVEVTKYDTIINNVYHHDTIMVVKHIYHDTLYVFPGRTVYHVPDEVQHIVNYFYEKAREYGWTTMTGGSLYVDYWPQDEAPPHNRSSIQHTVWTNGQWVIRVKDTIPYEYWFTPLFRELAHDQLDLPYTADGEGSIMDPSFDPMKLKIGDPDEKAYLDELFKNPI